MAVFTTVDETKAPNKPPVTNHVLAARMGEYDGYVRAAKKKGHVGSLIPSVGESPRGVIRRVKAAGRRVGKPVTAWQDEGTVYFTVQ